MTPRGTGDLDAQTGFWDGAAARTFSHPLPLTVLRRLLPPGAAFLDYGCGYGRLCSELVDAGYRDVVGIDISAELIRRGRALDGRLDLRLFDGASPGLPPASFDACLLVAVLNCVPSEAGQERLVGTVRALLRPNGILFLSDYPLQRDGRSRERYRQGLAEFGVHGTFRAEGGVFRHLAAQRLRRLLSGFDLLWSRRIAVRTMSGRAAEALQLIARAKGPGKARP